MNEIQNIWSRLRSLLQRRAVKEDIDEELRFHIEQHTVANIAKGMSPEEAAREARKRFGNLQGVREECREVRGASFGETMLQDLRFGARMLRKNPGFTAVAVLTLALGIGANTAIFSVVNAVLLRPLPYENPGQLVRLWADMSGRRTDQNQFSPADITDFRDQLTSFEDIGMFDLGLSANLTGGAQPERVNGSEASPGVFTTLRVKPVLGRTFLPNETEVAQSKVALVSEGLWKRRFGADPNFAGRTVQLDGQSFTVVGVLPGSFKFPEQVDLWLPFSFTAADWKNDRQHCYVDVVGRLKTGSSLIQAKAELETIAQRLAPTFPDSRKQWGLSLMPLHEQVVGKVSSALWILFGAVTFVLLIACVNVANLLLARAAGRQREITIRVALGASWLRIVRQLLTETMLLSALGGGAGALLAVWSVKLFSASSFNSLPHAENVTIAGPVLVFTLLVSLLTGVICGLAPALKAANPNLNETLRESGRHLSNSRGGLRNSLVVSEIALSLVLLVGGGLLIHSFLRLRSVPVGFDPRHLLTLQVTLPKTQYPDTERQNAFLQQALQRIVALPGVKAAAATINPPLLRAWGMGYWVPDHDNVPDQIADNANVTPNYFRTMGIPLLKGRDFSDQDSTKALPVVVISEALARKHFPNENPIGKRLSVGGDRQIVGVVGDVKPRGLELESKPHLYLPYAQKPTTASFLTFTIRTAPEPLSLAGSIEKAIQGLDRNLPVADVRAMDEIIAASLAQRRLTMLLLSAFAAIAVTLASIGIYGLVSYSVAQRSREMGIRMALGAPRGHVLALVIVQGMKLVLVGALTGLVAAHALSRVMQTLLFGVRPTDPLTFAGVSLFLIVVALVACWLPARRLARVDPMEALRHE